MAANGNFQNDAEEYEWVLNNSLLWDAVFNHFGYDPIYEYGSYRQVDTMRSIILKWLHRQDFYWDERWGLNDVEVEEEDEEDEEDQQDAQQNVVEQKIKRMRSKMWWMSKMKRISSKM